MENSLINQFPGNIYCKDLNGIIVWHNNNVFENFKRKIGIDNLIGKTVYDLFDPKSADECYKDDIKILKDLSHSIKIKQEKLYLINKEVENYLTITKPMISADHNVTGIIVNTINFTNIQKHLQFDNISQSSIKNENQMHYVIKEILIIVNLMRTMELNQDLNNLLIELKTFVNKLLNYNFT